VLSPVKRGAAGTTELNKRLKARLNPPRTEQGKWEGEQGKRAAEWYDSQPSYEHVAQPSEAKAPDKSPEGIEGKPLGEAARGARKGEERSDVSVGDSMIQLTNNYEAQIFNGDCGRVAWVRREGRGLRFSVHYTGKLLGEDGVDLEYTLSSLGKDVALSYALTVHKAQGSEYPVVVMPVLPQHGTMLYRNLLYTGFSRAKQLLVLVGSEAAMCNAAANDVTSQRITLLAERIDNRNFAPPTTRHMSEF
jgi:ATP-dependent exoDNAse (exonuclease V) alpha subunit